MFCSVSVYHLNFVFCLSLSGTTWIKTAVLRHTSSELRSRGVISNLAWSFLWHGSGTQSGSSTYWPKRGRTTFKKKKKQAWSWKVWIYNCVDSWMWHDCFAGRFINGWRAGVVCALNKEPAVVSCLFEAAQLESSLIHAHVEWLWHKVIIFKSCVLLEGSTQTCFMQNK